MESDALPPPYHEQDPFPRMRHAPLPTRPASIPAPRPSEPQASSSASDTFISAASYFAMRPIPPQRHDRLVSTTILLIPGDAWHDLPVPTIIQESGIDIHAEDWAAFLNHLVPSRGRTSGSRMEHEKTGTLAARPNPPPAPTIPDSRHLQRVVEEWNHGFFICRGVSLVLQTQPHPALPTAKNRSKIGDALYEAVKAGDVSTTRLLLSHGADPDWRPTHSTPALVRAVKSQNQELIAVLLERAPDLEASAPAEGTALYHAVKLRNLESVRLLLLYGSKVSSAHGSGSEPVLYRATENDDYAILEALLSQPDIKIDATPPGGASSLYKAAKEGRIEMARLLLAHGAAPDCEEPGGGTAMSRAAKRGDFEMTRLLLEAGAKVDKATSGDSSALCHATKARDVEMIRLLLRHGADINKKTNRSKSALVIATKKGDTELVNLLLQGPQDAFVETPEE